MRDEMRHLMTLAPQLWGELVTDAPPPLAQAAASLMAASLGGAQRLVSTRAGIATNDVERLAVHAVIAAAELPEELRALWVSVMSGVVR